MKKILTALVALTLTASAFAAVNQNDGYFSTKHASAKPASAKSLASAPTDILVTNVSNETIFLNVPNTPIYDTIYSGDNDHIYNQNGAFYTTIRLLNSYQQEFFSATVCPRALVTVKYTSYFGVSIDSSMC